MKTLLTGIVLGSVLERGHFRQWSICIRYAARLRVHDLEAWPVHLR